MNSKVSKLLKQQGIKNASELTKDERETLDTWERILSKDQITVEKIVEFSRYQIGIIENQFKNLDNTAQKNERLILLYTVYKTLIDLITAPRTEQENLEQYINSLLTRD